MDIAATKMELMRLLLETEKESVLAKLKVVFEEESDWGEQLSPREKAELEEGLRQADRGELIEEQEITKLFEKWR